MLPMDVHTAIMLPIDVYIHTMYGKVAESGSTVELNVSVFGVQEMNKDSHSSSLNQLLSVTLYG